MLQPSDTANAEEEKTKHKFMVQSMYVPEEEYSLGRFSSFVLVFYQISVLYLVPSILDTIWKTTDPSEIMDTRLKVVFKPSDEAPHHEEVPTEAVHQEVWCCWLNFLFFVVSYFLLLCYTLFSS